ncbi:MAG TPA: hypothetical protein VNV43_03415 [Candidatus Acidoferrales bacterium]|nr:hypothetical protein [Candidatus Acidoferrales bacterium]
MTLGIFVILTRRAVAWRRRVLIVILEIDGAVEALNAARLLFPLAMPSDSFQNQYLCPP